MFNFIKLTICKILLISNQFYLANLKISTSILKMASTKTDFPKTLQEFGYAFNNGKIMKIEIFLLIIYFFF